MFDNGDGHVQVGSGDQVLIVQGQGDGVTVAVQNTGSATVYLGGSEVSTVDGYPLAAGASVGFVAEDGDDLYGITAAASTTVAVLRQGV